LEQLQGRMSSFEFLCWAVFLAGILYFASKHVVQNEQPIASVTEIGQAYHQKTYHQTEEDKAFLCKQWRECEVLQEAIVWESRSESIEGQRMVAKVILNRVEHPHWPNTVEEVVYEPKQFSYVEDMHLQKTPSKKDWTTAGKVAYNMLHGIIDVDTQATFYHTKQVKPYWAKNKEVVAVVDSHIFYNGGR